MIIEIFTQRQSGIPDCHQEVGDLHNYGAFEISKKCFYCLQKNHFYLRKHQNSIKSFSLHKIQTERSQTS